MITKQQALEFIYELSQRYRITLDIPNEYIFVHNKAYCNESTLESLVEKVIINNLNGRLFEHMKRIPVTIDMLEVGQTYEIHIQQDGMDKKFINQFSEILDETLLKFEKIVVCKDMIREIFKEVQ